MLCCSSSNFETLCRELNYSLPSTRHFQPTSGGPGILQIRHISTILLYRVFRKIVGFFHNSLAYIAVRDLLSSQRNVSVQSLLLASNFFTTNSSRVLAREMRWQTFENSWKKIQYIMNTLYLKQSLFQIPQHF